LPLSFNNAGLSGSGFRYIADAGTSRVTTTS
jgi:hypothetical protein